MEVNLELLRKDQTTIKDKSERSIDIKEEVRPSVEYVLRGLFPEQGNAIPEEYTMKALEALVDSDWFIDREDPSGLPEDDPKFREIIEKSIPRQ
jgi:hypothetical protein